MINVEEIDINAPHLCPCCGQHKFPIYNSFKICPVCAWQDDLYQEEFPDKGGCANNCSLNEWKKQWKDYMKSKK